MSKIISAISSLSQNGFNENLKEHAVTILSEENYSKLIKSYHFMFWFQILGYLSGFIIPFIVLPFFTKNFEYILVGALLFCLLWGTLLLIISMFLPQGKIYRQFSKMYRKDPTRMENVDNIFKDNKAKNIKLSMESSNIKEYAKQAFEMKIDDVFVLIGRGTVVSGTIRSGMCSVGDCITIKKADGTTIDTQITDLGVGNKRRSSSYAYINENVGLTLRDVSKEQVSIGDILIKK